MKLEWSKLYCGGEHLKGLPNGFQITVENGNEVYLINLKGSHPFTAIKTYYGTPDQVKRIGEEWAVQLRDEFGGRNEK